MKGTTSKRKKKVIQPKKKSLKERKNYLNFCFLKKLIFNFFLNKKISLDFPCRNLHVA